MIFSRKKYFSVESECLVSLSKTSVFSSEMQLFSVPHRQEILAGSAMILVSEGHWCVVSVVKLL